MLYVLGGGPYHPPNFLPSHLKLLHLKGLCIRDYIFSRKKPAPWFAFWPGPRQGGSIDEHDPKRSVDRKRREWIAKDSYYSSEQRSLWGQERGIRSGKSRRKRNEDRDRAIIQAVDKGRSLRDVGREFGLTAEGVRWIIRRGVK